jgi:hypothetical protein
MLPTRVNTEDLTSTPLARATPTSFPATLLPTARSVLLVDAQMVASRVDLAAVTVLLLTVLVPK